MSDDSPYVAGMKQRTIDLLFEEARDRAELASLRLRAFKAQEQTPPAPALTDAARHVVETGIAWERDPGSLDLTQAHIAAVRAYKESDK